MSSKLSQKEINRLKAISGIIGPRPQDGEFLAQMLLKMWKYIQEMEREGKWDGEI